MAFSNGSRSISKDDILNKTSEFDILQYYLGIKKIPCVINSPLRHDTNPSFGLYWGQDGRIRFLDFSTKDRGETFELLSKLWNLDFYDTLEKIYKDSPNFNNTRVPVIITKGKRTYSSTTDLQCKIREWKDYDLKYWSSYGISLPWLKFGEIYPISHLIVTKDGRRYVIPADKYAYVYIERKDGQISLKIYQPFNKLHKWSNKHDSSVWDLWRQLPPNGDKLIITSSRKDALCIWENTGIPSTGLQAESYIPKQHVVEELKKRFNKVFILYDNDFEADKNHGAILGNIIANKFNLKQILIPQKYFSKDSSDLYKNFGKEILQRVITNLTTN